MPVYTVKKRAVLLGAIKKLYVPAYIVYESLSIM